MSGFVTNRFNGAANAVLAIRRASASPAIAPLINFEPSRVISSPFPFKKVGRGAWRSPVLTGSFPAFRLTSAVQGPCTRGNATGHEG